MAYNWENILEKYDKQILSEIYGEAVARAQFLAQDDLNTNGIQTIANATGHDDLARACYLGFQISNVDMDIVIYYNSELINGFFGSNSSFHKSGDVWDSVDDNYKTSSSEFWNNRLNVVGNIDDSHGVVESEWIMHNFWHGIKTSTNGWPNSSAEYLKYTVENETSAKQVAQNFIDTYIQNESYEKHIEEELYYLYNRR